MSKLKNVTMPLKEVLYSVLFDYETAKTLQIRSWKIALVNRLIQLSIILYVSLWVMYHDKGYQSFDYPVSGVTAKLKGLAYTNITDSGPRVWDVADFVVPPQQNYGFFVATNMVVTRNQTLSYCPESLDVYGATCKNNDECPTGELMHLGSGVKTGKCVISDQNSSVHVCEIYGWCPTEHDKMPIPNEPLLSSAPNFTVLLKNSIKFTKFHVKRRNILEWMNQTYLNTCRYNPNHDMDKYCPIFKLSDLIEFSEAKNKDIWVYGALLSIHIEWECNLDISLDFCLPLYTFRRLDDFEFDLGKGWNFRYSHNYIEDGIEKRTLMKAYGIQCFITISGRGRKFDPFIFSMNIGSGLALLGIASVLCDIIIIYIDKKRNSYKQAIVDIFKTSTLNNSDNDNVVDQLKYECKSDTTKQQDAYFIDTINCTTLDPNYIRSLSTDCITDHLSVPKDDMAWNDFNKLSSSIQLALVDESSLNSFSCR